MKIASGGSKRTVLLSEINVTPFVDVMLVLLIIFMVTAPMLEQGIGISLPETRASGAKLTTEPFVLQIKKDNKIYIGNQSIILSDLSDKLKAMFQHKKDRVVYLQADKSVPYGFVARTLGEIKFSGIEQVSLITNAK